MTKTWAIHKAVSYIKRARELLGRVGWHVLTRKFNGAALRVAKYRRFSEENRSGRAG